MKLSLHKDDPISSRSIFFPFFSLLFHFALFFFFVGVQSVQTPFEIKDDEIIAMVDLNELPPELKPPEPEPKLEPEPKIETPVLSAETNSGSDPEASPENESPEPESEPILDPELDEVLEDEVGGDLPAPIETAQNIVIPLPPPAFEPEPVEPDTPLPEPGPPEIAEPEPEASHPEAVPEAALASEPEPPISEAIAEKSSSPAPEPVVPVIPEAAAPEPPRPAPDPPSAQEVAKASEVQDPLKPQAKKELVAAIKKSTPPPPPPKPKLSKEKVKKSGLLALLGKKKRRSMSKNPLFAKTLKRPKSKRLQVRVPDANTVSTESSQKMARLKNKLLKSEQNRLMKKRSVGRKRKSQLKIVQGSGRNFGVISSAIAQEEWRLTTVYNRLLQRNPGLQGNLIIEFTISPEGRVIKGHVLTSSFANTHFEKALIQAIRLWKFPVAKEGETTILYPLAFSPAG